MIKLKMCMLGAFAVGKTSLVARYVSNTFSDKYLTTVGVKINSKALAVDGRDVTLALWDLAGEDPSQGVQMSYLRGANGFFVIADGTRAATLDTALSLRDKALAAAGPVPWLLIINKADLADTWELTPDRLAGLPGAGVPFLRGSAKTGEGVEEAFATLTRRMLAPAGGSGAGA